MHKFILFFGLSIFLLACNTAPEGKAQVAEDGKVTAISFGEEISQDNSISYEEMISKMANLKIMDFLCQKIFRVNV